MKVVINVRYGGFSVSKPVYEALGLEWDGYGYLTDWGKERGYRWHADINFRSDPDLIEAIEEVGVEEASGSLARLRIVDIPDDAHDPRIDEYDGMEQVCEGRIWR